jgi:hypothetical protein
MNRNRTRKIINNSIFLNDPMFNNAGRISVGRARPCAWPECYCREMLGRTIDTVKEHAKTVDLDAPLDLVMDAAVVDFVAVYSCMAHRCLDTSLRFWAIEQLARPVLNRYERSMLRLLDAEEAEASERRRAERQRQAGGER